MKKSTHIGKTLLCFFNLRTRVIPREVKILLRRREKMDKSEIQILDDMIKGYLRYRIRKFRPTIRSSFDPKSEELEKGIEFWNKTGKSICRISWAIGGMKLELCRNTALNVDDDLRKLFSVFRCFGANIEISSI